MGEIQWIAGAYDLEIMSTTGIVGREIARRTLNVQTAIVRRCPVRTGRARSSFRSTFGADALGPFGLCSSDVDYVWFLHNGTKYMKANSFITDGLAEGSTT